MNIRSIVALAVLGVVAGCGGSKSVPIKTDASDARPSDAGARDGLQAMTDGPAGTTDGRLPDGAGPDVARDGSATADTRLADGGDARMPDSATPDGSSSDVPASMPDSAATPDTSAAPDTAPPMPDTAPPTPDAPDPDAALPDTALPVDLAPDTGSTTGIDGPVVTLCPGNIPLSAACGLYCAAITTGCTGLLAQYPGEAECVSICLRPAWPCGQPGDTDDTLACRMGQLVPLATQPELAPLACPNAGLNSLICR